MLAAQLSAVAAAHAGPVTIAEERLTTNAADQRAPSVSGTRVVYEDQRDGDYSIFMWDVATDSETRVTRNDGIDQRYPAVSGDKVVFQDNSTGDWNIRVIDLKKDAVPGVGRRITTDDSFDQRHPDISGSKVVFDDLRFATQINDPEIVLYDLSTGKQTRLTYGDTPPLSPPYSDDTHWHWWPVIWGDWVAYENSYDPGSMWDSVSAMNIKNKVEKQLSSDSVLAYRPAISGSQVVFADDDGDVRVFDLATDASESNGTAVPAPAGNQTSPDISGTKVVYTDDRNGNNELYLYDLAYGEESRMTNNASSQSAAALSGGRLVWEDERNGHTDIYFGELILPRLTASAPSVVAYGGVGTRLAGALTTYDGAPINGVNVVLEMSPDGATWNTFGSPAVTDVDGRYSLATPRFYHARYLRANFKGTVVYPSAQSASRRVKPKAWVRTPIAPETMQDGTYYAVYGWLKPRHAAGTYPVRVYRWRKTASGSWKSFGYVSAKAYDYSAYTKYLRRMRFSTTGTWRVRAYAPADYWHAAAWSSGYDYIKVK